MASLCVPIRNIVFYGVLARNAVQAKKAVGHDVRLLWLLVSEPSKHEFAAKNTSATGAETLEP